MKAAVIGAGPHGRRIVEVLRDFDGVELAAVVDRSPQALAAVELPPEAARYASTDELWAGGGAELVCVATNGDTHAALSEQAIQAGASYLLVEKPMACSLADCDRILSAARAADVRLAIDHSRRYWPAYRWLRDRIRSGAWGTLRAVWIQRPDIGLGCNATHSFDLVTFLSGQSVRRVTGWVDKPLRKNPRGEQFVDPGGLVVMELEGGARATVAQIEDGAGPTSLELDLTAARVRLCERSGAIEVLEGAIPPGGGRPKDFALAEVPAGLTARCEMLPMIRDCLRDLVSQNLVEADGRQGRAAIEVLVAAYLSHERGNRPIDLPLTARADVERVLPVT